MGRLPDALAIAFAAAMLLLAAPTARAQEQAPDPRMLLNLDLFTAQSNAQGGSDSMFERIRALRAMGYLEGSAKAAPAAAPTSGANPDADSGGQRPSNTLDLGEQK